MQYGLCGLYKRLGGYRRPSKFKVKGRFHRYVRQTSGHLAASWKQYKVPVNYFQAIHLSHDEPSLEPRAMRGLTQNVPEVY